MRKQIWLLIAALLVAIVAVFWFVYWQPQQAAVNNQVSDQSTTPAPVAPSEVIQDKMPPTNPFEVPVNPYEAYVNPFGQGN